MSVLKLVLAFVFVSSPVLAAEKVTPAEAARLVSEGAAVLTDVREQYEIEETGMAEPALWLAKSEIDGDTAVYREFLGRLDRSQTLIIYCRSGRRSALVAEHFHQLGFSVLDMGAFDDWRRAGLPVRPL